MAQIQSAGRRSGKIAVVRRQIKTRSFLASGLSIDYRVLHSLHWVKGEKGHFGYAECEANFIVVARNQGLRLVQQKFAFPLETEEGIVTSNNGKKKRASIYQSRGRSMGLARVLARTVNPCQRIRCGTVEAI